jgi:hypothetical protein
VRRKIAPLHFLAVAQFVGNYAQLFHIPQDFVCALR